MSVSALCAAADPHPITQRTLANKTLHRTQRGNCASGWIEGRAAIGGREQTALVAGVRVV